MKPATPGILRRSLALAAALALAGCASLFVSVPRRLYRLSAPRDFPPGLPHSTAELVIERPQAPAGIDVSRIALSRSPLTLDYYADAEWTDRVPDLIEDLLLDAFENSGALTAVDRGSAGLRADFVLRSEIRHFEAVYGGEGTLPQAWVEIIVRLVAVRARAIAGQSRFEQRVAAAANDVPAVVAAFDAATTAVLRDIVVWTVGNAALSRSGRAV
jgi:cholesterol transport system auxiliary component